MAKLKAIIFPAEIGIFVWLKFDSNVSSSAVQQQTEVGKMPNIGANKFRNGYKLGNIPK